MPAKNYKLVKPRSEVERLLRKQIEKGENLLNHSIGSEKELNEVRTAYQEWDEYNEELLNRIVDTHDLCEEYSRLGVGPIAVLDREPTFSEEVEKLRERITIRINKLKSICKRLDLITEATGTLAVSREIQEVGNRVFIVHGRDEGSKEMVARFVEKLVGSPPIILQERPDQGRTLIEKFEDYGEVDYAIVLLTPDDVGALKAEYEEKGELQPRARQNVILELGFFLGKLGRKRVCALLKGNVEIPSDLSGIL